MKFIITNFLNQPKHPDFILVVTIEFAIKLMDEYFSIIRM